MDQLNIINNFVDLGGLNTEQLDKVSAIDLHSMMLTEDAEKLPQIIKKLSNDKLQALVDIYSWNKEGFDPIHFSTWMNVLLSFPPQEAAQQIKRIDRQELQLFISSILDIQWLNPDEQYEGNPYISPDNVFVMFPKEEAAEVQTAIELVNIAYLAGMDFGRALCVDAMTTIYSITEEDAKRFKEARLSEEGIPSYMDSLELFHYEDPTKLLSKILKMVGNEQFKKSPQNKEYVISQFAVVPRSYWDASFKIDAEMVDDMQMELSSLLTASIVMNNVMGEDAKHIKDVLERSKSYFNIGLELVKENTNRSLTEVVSFVKLRHIFRLGFSLLIDLKNNAVKVKTGLDALQRPDVITIDEEIFIKALLSPIPMFQLGLSAKPKQFDTLEQLKEARRKLSLLASKILNK